MPRRRGRKAQAPKRPHLGKKRNQRKRLEISRDRERIRRERGL